MTTRRLAAILTADVVGFSSMMEKDEPNSRPT
jgi:class 3 adenylate cyclase